jgi:hypothetical protein
VMILLQGHRSVGTAVSCRLWILYFVYKHSKNYVLPHNKHTAPSLQMLLVRHSDALTVRTKAELLVCVVNRSGSHLPLCSVDSTSVLLCVPPFILSVYSLFEWKLPHYCLLC